MENRFLKRVYIGNDLPYIKYGNIFEYDLNSSSYYYMIYSDNTGVGRIAIPKMDSISLNKWREKKINKILNE